MNGRYDRILNRNQTLLRVFRVFNGKKLVVCHYNLAEYVVIQGQILVHASTTVLTVLIVLIEVTRKKTKENHFPVSCPPPNPAPPRYYPHRLRVFLTQRLAYVYPSGRWIVFPYSYLRWLRFRYIRHTKLVTISCTKFATYQVLFL